MKRLAALAALACLALLDGGIALAGSGVISSVSG
jgi:hypothetical protein